MNYVIAKNYLCFLTLLEMIIEDFANIKITQQNIAEEFGITVPYGYKTEVNNVRFSSVENDFGVEISEKNLQNYFDKENLGLRVKYIDGLRISELDLDFRLKKYLEEQKYVILAYSYGILYNNYRYDSLGHVALLEKVIEDDVIQVYDPGPDKAGSKKINIFKMYDAMKKKGGLYLIDKKRKDVISEENTILTRSN